VSRTDGGPCDGYLEGSGENVCWLRCVCVCGWGGGGAVVVAVVASCGGDGDYVMVKSTDE
jgi:hypothetical protein